MVADNRERCSSAGVLSWPPCFSECVKSAVQKSRAKTEEAFASSSSVTRAEKGDGAGFLTVDLFADTERNVFMGPQGAGTPIMGPPRK